MKLWKPKSSGISVGVWYWCVALHCTLLCTTILLLRTQCWTGSHYAARFSTIESFKWAINSTHIYFSTCTCLLCDYSLDVPARRLVPFTLTLELKITSLRPWVYYPRNFNMLIIRTKYYSSAVSSWLSIPSCSSWFSTTCWTACVSSCFSTACCSTCASAANGSACDFLASPAK